MLDKEQIQLKYYLNEFHHEFYKIKLRIKIFDEIAKGKKLGGNQYLVFLKLHEHPRAIISAIYRILDKRGDSSPKQFIKFLRKNNCNETYVIEDKFEDWRGRIDP